MYDKDIETGKVTIEDGDYVIMSLVLFYLYIFLGGLSHVLVLGMCIVNSFLSLLHFSTFD